MNTAKFYTVDNLKLMVNIFRDYMLDKFNFNLESHESEGEIRKMFFGIMNQINSENPNASLQEMNILTLGKVKDSICSKYQLQGSMGASSAPSKKPNIENLNREKTIYGERPMKANMIVPEANPYVKKNDEANNQERNMFDRLVSERNKEVEIKQPPNFNEVSPVTKEIAEDPSEFVKKLKDLELERNRIELDINVYKKPDGNVDPAQMYRQELNNQPVIKRDIEIRNEMFNEGKERTVIPRNVEQKNIYKYIAVNSMDRDWATGESLYRYSYGVNFMSKGNEIMMRYRNIESIRIGKVVIPDEINLSQSFNFPYTFSFPYLFLRIDEFNDVYDGTNETIRRGFCKLVYDRSYRGPNGRGYIVLKPAQKEEKYFYPAPLASLQKLSISIVRPTGDLYNDSQDGAKVLTVEQDTVNTDRLKVTLATYFDQNEFYNGDYVVFANTKITKLVPQQLDADVNGFNDFMNRGEGHQILQLGTPNGNGYYNSFYIKCPGAFNKSTGDFDLKLNLTNCLDYFNVNNTSTNPIGVLLNSSLQNSISFKISTIVDDARILDTQSVFNF